MLSHTNVFLGYFKIKTHHLWSFKQYYNINAKRFIWRCWIYFKIQFLHRRKHLISLLQRYANFMFGGKPTILFFEQKLLPPKISGDKMSFYLTLKQGKHIQLPQSYKELKELLKNGRCINELKCIRRLISNIISTSGFQIYFKRRYI